MAETSPGLELFQQSHERLLQQFLELERQKLPTDVIDKQLMDTAGSIVRDFNTSALMVGRTRLSDEDEREFRAQARGIMGGGALVPLLEREDVENIHILGHDKVVLSLADGSRISAAPLAASEEELVMMIRHLAATAGHTSRRFDTAAPILDLRLASGHRLFAVTAVAERTSVVIRRHRMLQSSLESLEKYGTVTPEMTAVLRAAVRPPNPANMLVVGGTGAGKTTLLRALLSEVPQSELVVTIEDTLELHLRSSGLHERTLALETRTSNTEGLGEISMYDLCKAALRMSPDRVIVGEVRGGEVMQLLQSMGIGNDGSLGTIHAGSTRAAINKMLIYAQRSPDSPTPDSVLREIAEVLHLLVYIKKLPDGRRAITSIREVVSFEDGGVVTSEVFAPGPDGVGVYSTPFKADGEPLARLVSAGFDPEVLGEPYRPSSVVPQSRPQPQQQPQPTRQQPQPQQQPQPTRQQPQPQQQPQPTRQQPQPQQPQPTRQQPQPQQPQPQPQPQPRPSSSPNPRANNPNPSSSPSRPANNPNPSSPSPANNPTSRSPSPASRSPNPANNPNHNSSPNPANPSRPASLPARPTDAAPGVRCRSHSAPPPRRPACDRPRRLLCSLSEPRSRLSALRPRNTPDRPPWSRWLPSCSERWWASACSRWSSVHRSGLCARRRPGCASSGPGRQVSSCRRR